VASLFSDEFYARVVHYMQPDGLLVQWLQTYETDTQVVASIVKALASHFGTYAIYNLNDTDILILATPGPAFKAPDDRLLQSPLLRAELERIGVRSVAEMQARLIGDNHSLGRVLAAMPVPPNSDFFPFVDLNAVRLRYLDRSAVELVQLTLMPVPFLEFLGAASRGGSTEEPSPHSVLVHDREVRNAMVIRHAVISGKLESLSVSAAASLLLVDMNASRCAEVEGRNAWLRSIRWISDSTASYLSASELKEVWDKVNSTPCYRGISGEHKTWADLYAAVAARDAPAIVQLGTTLLGAGSARSNEELTYLTILVAAAHVRMDELAQARDLLQTHWNLVDHSGKNDFPLRELLVLSQAPRGAHDTVANR
jgi:spermidine synthase